MNLLALSGSFVGIVHFIGHIHRTWKCHNRVDMKYRAAISTGCIHRRTGDETVAALHLKQEIHTHMAKRAVLLDPQNECIAHLTYAEIDDYIARGLVERLTPVKAKTHVFRLIDKKAQADAEIVDLSGFDESSLSASTSRANAGESHVGANLWAQRRVRIWPYIGDTRATRVACQRPAARRRH